MKRIGLMIVVVLTLVLQACTYRQTAAPEGQPPATTQTPAPTQTTEQAQTTEPTQTTAPTQSDRPKGKLLVEVLPTGVEGLELKDGELRLLEGYDFVEQPENRFAVARMRDGQHVAIGGCGCSRLGVCQPVKSGGIIVCRALGLCIGSCRLAVTAGGVSTDIIMY